jgi:hypothetical protein
MVMNNLLPGSLALALEEIFKLKEGVSPIKIDLLGSLFEVGDGPVKGKFNTKFTSVLVDFCLDFVCNL